MTKNVPLWHHSVINMSEKYVMCSVLVIKYWPRIGVFLLSLSGNCAHLFLF